MRRPPLPILFLLLTLALAAGCRVTWVRNIQLTTRLLNDHNELLTVEGNCNLPDGAVLEARLRDRAGRRWAYGRGEVRNERFFTLLEISRCPGFKPLTLEVYFDPLAATARVQEFTGERGEALAGSMLWESHGRILVMKRQRIVLTLSARQARVRRLVAGDGDVDELRSYLARHPDDGMSMIGLGLAFLKQRPSERHPGSEAFRMLLQGVKIGSGDANLDSEGRTWLAALEERQRREDEERARREAPPFDPKYLTATLVNPGRAVGLFELGTPERALLLNFKLRPTGQPGEFTIAEFPELKFALNSDALLARITPLTSRYATREGLRIGSDGDFLRKLIPGLQVDYQDEAAPRANGRIYSHARLELEGLNLELERSYDPNFPLPQESVTAMEVVPGSPPASSSTPTSSPTP